MNPEEALLKAPAAIRKAQGELWDAKQRAERARFALRMKEADALAGVRAALEGKRSSADDREAMAQAKLTGDPEAAALRRQIGDDEALAHRIGLHVDYLEATQKNARTLLLSRSPANLVFEGAEP